MGCRALQLPDYFRLIKPEDNPIKYREARFNDTNGSLTSKAITGGDSYSYSYNLQNRLSAVIDRTEEGNTVAITTNYVYNQSGIRVKANSTINGIEQNRIFLLDSGFTGYSQVFEESAVVGGDLTKSYTLGHDIISQTSNHNSFIAGPAPSK